MFMEKFNYTLKDLESCTVKELVKIAADFEIAGRTKMKKADLISAIMSSQKVVEVKDDVAESETNTETTVENSVENVENSTGESVEENEVVMISPSKPTYHHKEGTRTRESYIDAVEIGSIIVFDVPGADNKALSAKVTEIKRNENNSVVRVTAETRKGAIYKIGANKIIWIKTGKRYPKGIFEKLIGFKTHSEETKEGEENAE